MQTHQRFFRIQVKSCTSQCKGGYAVSTKRSFGRKYTRSHADLIAAYVIPRGIAERAPDCASKARGRSSPEVGALRSPWKKDAWYIIPIAALGGRKSIYVYPRNPRSRGMFQPYRDAWQLLTG